jgi:hypothetical protein
VGGAGRFIGADDAGNGLQALTARGQDRRRAFLFIY